MSTKVKEKRKLNMESYQKSGLLFTLFCIILFYPPFFRGSFFDYELLPTHVFSFTLFAIWLGRKIKYGDYKIFKSHADVLAGLIVFMYFVSCFYGVNKRLAIGEFLKYSNYFFLYLMAKEFGKDLKGKEIILNTLLGSAFVVAMVGIGAAVGTWNYNGAYVWERINSTLQYPNALAAYMGALLFISVGMSLKTREHISKIIYNILSVIFIFTLILTYSRGMWALMPPLVLIYIFLIQRDEKISAIANIIANTCVGAIFSVIFKKGLANPVQGELWGIFIGMLIITVGVTFLLDQCNKFFKKINYKIIYIILAVIVIVGGILSAAVYQELPNVGKDNAQISTITKGVLKVVPQSIIWRFQDIDKLQGGNGRTVFYQDAFKIIKDYPLVGVGGGGWSTLYRQYQSYDYPTTQAHNYFIQACIEIGSIGLIFIVLYLLCIMKVFYYLNKREDEDKVINTSIFLGIIAFFIHSVLDFDLTYASLSMILWTLIGILVSKNEEEKLIKLNKKGLVYFGLCCSILLVIVSASFYYANRSAVQVRSVTNAQELKKAIQRYETASKLDPFKVEYKEKLGKVYFIALQNLNKDYYEKAQKTYNQLINLAEYDPRILQQVAQFYLMTDKIEEGINFIDKTVQVQPMRAENYQMKARAYYKASDNFMKNGQKEKAQEYIDRLLNIKKEFEKVAKRSLKPMEMTDEMKKHIQDGKKLREKL
ncbi:MAG: O-antigen ligase family protein [Marinisporobacter sp.]|jgi:O-antigen ligase|nr:O-antigen ligase family protein [Marinisporobacter sp.]